MQLLDQTSLVYQKVTITDVQHRQRHQLVGVEQVDHHAAKALYEVELLISS